jgi:hypothetical protein
MRERPIIFSAEMVRAILAGRKTQTRRVVGERDRLVLDFLTGDADGGPTGATADLGQTADQHGLIVWSAEYPDEGGERLPCPFGAPGDRLWVRETWFEECDPETVRPYETRRARYLATETEEVMQMDDDGGWAWNKDGTAKSPWRSPIHMPRWASRITLELTQVRVDRLQGISLDDVVAEGVTPEWSNGSTVASFASLWDSINAKRGHPWDSNPWVWALGFRRIESAELAA